MTEPNATGRWRAVGVGLLQLSVGVALIGLLLGQAAASGVSESLLSGPKDYGRLAFAAGLLLVSTLLSFLRWRLVARAAELPMTVAEAIRFGAAGYAANFFALGNIGGDVLKAALLARGLKGRRALAVSTVVVDRLMGLLALLLFASAGVLLSGDVLADAPAAARVIARATLAVTLLAVGCFAVATAPGRPLWRLAFAVRRLPVVGSRLAGFLLVLDAYRSHRPAMFGALAVGLATDAAYVLSFLCVASALPLTAPDAASHFLLVPLGMIAGALPLSPSGLGTTEAVIDLFYQSLATAPAGHGTTVALTHRMLTLGLGAVSVVYYFASRGERANTASTTAPTEAASDTGSGTASTPPAASRHTV